MNFPSCLAWFTRTPKRAAVPFRLPAAPTTAQWTVLDRDNLRRFLEGDTGVKLINRLRATEYAVAVANARDEFHTQHSAGKTCGYSECIRHVLSLTLSAAAPAPAANDSGESGEVRPVEREMEEYLNRMSP